MRTLRDSAAHVLRRMETLARRQSFKPFALGVMDHNGHLIGVRCVPGEMDVFVRELTRKGEAALEHGCDTAELPSSALPTLTDWQGAVLVRQRHWIAGVIVVAGRGRRNHELADFGRRCFLGQKLGRHDTAPRAVPEGTDDFTFHPNPYTNPFTTEE